MLNTSDSGMQTKEREKAFFPFPRREMEKLRPARTLRVNK